MLVAPTTHSCCSRRPSCSAAPDSPSCGATLAIAACAIVLFLLALARFRKTIGRMA